MKIIILGSGDVSLELAKYLVSAGHAVTVADSASDELSEIANRIDLRVITGNPASPETLRRAGAENTELLVATTAIDEVNITACCVAQFLFNIPRKIARLRGSEYLQESSNLFGSEGIPIDHIIATEDLTTQNIVSLIEYPGITSYSSFADNKIVLASAFVDLGGKLLGKSINEFNDYDGKARVLAVYRDGQYLNDFEKYNFALDDEVYFCCEQNRTLSQLSALKGLRIGDRHIVIAGGTHIADSLAKTLSERYKVKLIESDPKRAKRSAQLQHGTGIEVYNADPLDVDFIREENIDKADLYVAATTKDETNIMSSLLLKNAKAVRTIAVIKEESYLSLTKNKDEMTNKDIDNIVFPKESIISALLSQIRQESVEAMHLFRQGRSEAIEFLVEGGKFTSRVVGRRLEALNLPRGVSVGLVLRNKKIISIDNKFVFETGDRVVVYLDDSNLVKKLVKIFRPSPFWIPKW